MRLFKHLNISPIDIDKVDIYIFVHFMRLKYKM